jgi:S-adenosylmethionine decarboxylase
LNALGRHLLLELKNFNREVLNDLDYIRDCLCETAEQIGATVVNHAFHQFNPHGVSGVVVIAESHLCIHTWPEHGYAAVDIFTCGDTIEPADGIDPLIEKLGARDHSFMELNRGILTDSAIGYGIK